MSTTDPDPHRLGVALGRLMGGSRRTAKAAAMAAAATLHDGEQVEAVVAGRFRGHDAVAVLTDVGLLIVNSRQWAPEVVSIDELAGVEVEGWVERRAATLRVTAGGSAHVIDRINDTDVAEAFASAVRART